MGVETTVMGSQKGKEIKKTIPRTLLVFKLKFIYYGVEKVPFFKLHQY